MQRRYHSKLAVQFLLPTIRPMCQWWTLVHSTVSIGLMQIYNVNVSGTYWLFQCTYTFMHGYAIMFQFCCEFSIVVVAIFEPGMVGQAPYLSLIALPHLARRSELYILENKHCVKKRREQLGNILYGGGQVQVVLHGDIAHTGYEPAVYFTRRRNMQFVRALFECSLQHVV